MSSRALLAAVCLALAGGCGDSSTTPSPTAAPPPAPAPEPDPSADYTVTFTSTWSAATHPDRFPPNPHFSGLIGGTHRQGVLFWEPGGIASNGIEAMAERGSKTPLDQDVRNAIDRGEADNLLSGGDIPLSPGEVSLDFTASLDFPAVTLVSMLAPSPDWFTGVSNMSLLDDASGDWRDEIVVELHAYDAGTDSGRSYQDPDRDTQPREPIARIEGPPLANGGTVAPVGTFRFVRR